MFRFVFLFIFRFYLQNFGQLSLFKIHSSLVSTLSGGLYPEPILGNWASHPRQDTSPLEDISCTHTFVCLFTPRAV